MLLAACAWRAVPIALNAQSWRLLIVRAQRPALAPLVLLRWIGESVNSLLPWSQVGGDVVRARLLWLRGVGAAEAAAALLADLAVSLATQALFALLGIAALVAVAGSGGITRPLLLALAALVFVGLGVWSWRRFGVAALVRRATHRWRQHHRVAAIAGGAEALDASLAEALGRKRELAWSAAWHLAAWLASVVETRIVLHALGAPAGWGEALALESLGFAARTAAFMLPGGLGAQEAALIVLGTQAGLPAEAAIGLALIKRLREVVVGLPGLLAWGLLEHRERPQEHAP